MNEDLLSTTAMSSDEDASIRKVTDFEFEDTIDNLSLLSTSPPRHQPSRRTTNTGPKGVRADARAYAAAKREAAAKGALKQSMLIPAPATSLGDASGSEASEDEWMSRWREKRMKELSKSGVAGVNFFGQVDDVDAVGYLRAVDFDEIDDDDDYSTAAKRARARRNVVTVVLIYDNVPSLLTSFLCFSFAMCFPICGNVTNDAFSVVSGFETDVSSVFEACETVSYDALPSIIRTLRRRHAIIRVPCRSSLPTGRVDFQPRTLCRRT